MRTPAFLFGLALLLTLPATSQVAPTPRISGLSFAFEQNEVHVSFALRNAFDAKMVERLESGLATTLVYDLELGRDRRIWFDRIVASRRLEVSAKLDSLTNEYRVNYKLDGKLFDSRIFRDVAALESAMTRIIDLPAFTLGEHQRGEIVTLRVRADLGSRTWFSLIPTRVTTDWAESRRFVTPGG